LATSFQPKCVFSLQFSTCVPTFNCKISSHKSVFINLFYSFLLFTAISFGIFFPANRETCFRYQSSLYNLKRLHNTVQALVRLWYRRAERRRNGEGG
jgi:hypothetical protein